MPLSIEVVHAKDDLERISLRMGLLREQKENLEKSIDQALRSEENRRKLKQAADNIEDFCKDVMRIHRQTGR
jgi:hypothetical protein